jgi:hypothetical protein
MNHLMAPPEWSTQSDSALIGCRLGVSIGGGGGSIGSSWGNWHGLEPLLFFHENTSTTP